MWELASIAYARTGSSVGSQRCMVARGSST